MASSKCSNSLVGHQQSHLARPVPQSGALTPVLQHPKVSHIAGTGMGLIKSVRGRWGHQDKRMARSRSSSSTYRQASGDGAPRRCVDLLESGLTKPRNCRRIVVLGAPRVGKTNLLRRFLGGDFEEHYQPTDEDFHRKLFHIRGQAYQVDLLDASGERDFPAKRRLSILTGDVFLLVFSLDDKDSLSKVSELLSEIKAAKAKLQKLKKPAAVPVVVCGNKADLGAEGTASRSDVGEILAEGASFFEASAKDGSGLEELFGELATAGGLPVETSPGRHQVVSIPAFQSLRGGGGGLRRSGAPRAAVEPAARRPSFASDLQMVLGSSTKHNKPEKCPIQ